jgi:anti-repressor protein
MNKLIKIESYTINGETIPAVSARELHAYLGNKAQFSNWIKDRIDQYGFLENIDFVTKESSLEQESRGYTPAKKEYFTTVDMAKELSMVERKYRQEIAAQ